jgi:hypothetical protein
MSIFYLFLISVLTTLSALIIFFLKVRRKYINNIGNAATNPQMLAVVFSASLFELWLLKDFHDLIIIICLFIAAIILFLLLKLTSSYFDKYNRPTNYSFFSGLTVITICFATPLFTYMLTLKYSYLIIYVLYALMNSIFAIGFSIFVVQLGNKLHITSR